MNPSCRGSNCSKVLALYIKGSQHDHVHTIEKGWSLCRTGALQLDLDTTPEGFPVVLRAKCPSWQEVVVGLTWRLCEGYQLHACWAISCYYLCVCVCLFVCFMRWLGVPLSLMKVNDNSIKMIIVPSPRCPRCCHRSESRDFPHAWCVSLKYFHQGSPKQYLDVHGVSN